MKMAKYIWMFGFTLVSLTTMGQTSLNYSRPGPMMHIPTSSLYNEPYLLRIGVAGQSTLGAFDTENWNKGLRS